MCERCQAVRGVGPESPHRVARALRWPRHHGVLARRGTLGVHLLTAQVVLVVGSGRDDRGGLAPRDRHGSREELRRYPWTERGGLCFLCPLGIRAPAAPQTPQTAAPVPGTSPERRGAIRAHP